MVAHTDTDTDTDTDTGIDTDTGYTDSNIAAFGWWRYWFYNLFAVWIYKSCIEC